MFLEKQRMAFLSLKIVLCPVYNAALDNDLIFIQKESINKIVFLIIVIKIR